MWKKTDEIPAIPEGGASGGYDPFEPLESVDTVAEGLLREGENVRLIAGEESALVAAKDVIGWRQHEDERVFVVRLRKGAKVLLQRGIIAERGRAIFGPFGSGEGRGDEGAGHENHGDAGQGEARHRGECCDDDQPHPGHDHGGGSHGAPYRGPHGGSAGPDDGG